MLVCAGCFVHACVGRKQLTRRRKKITGARKYTWQKHIRIGGLGVNVLIVRECDQTMQATMQLRSPFVRRISRRPHRCRSLWCLAPCTALPLPPGPLIRPAAANLSLTNGEEKNTKIWNTEKRIKCTIALTAAAAAAQHARKHTLAISN